MCDAMRDPPTPGTPLSCYWRDLGPVPEEGDELDLPLAGWTVRVRVWRVKDAKYVPGDLKHVSMEVIG